MAPKKDKGKEFKTATNVFTEVEKTFLNLELADCNKKVARLRTTVDQYEQRNEELQKAYNTLDEDRADIIAHLKKTLHVKVEENDEFKEKLKNLEEEREIEKAQFKQTISELEKNFTTMKDQLTSENKIYAGKLNTLEEFRALRDDLMMKFDKQQQAFKDQEMKYKRVIYDAEKKFVISKDNLKKEMESRLLKLAQDFQDATELRVAASTHRVIRENIAVSNELDRILSYQAKLVEEAEQHKSQELSARIAMELAEEERDKAINKNIVQMKVIDRVTAAYQAVLKDMALYEKKQVDIEKLQATIKKITKENDNLSLQVRILEQNLHAKSSAQSKAAIGASRVIKENVRLKKILKEAAFALQAALKLDQWSKSSQMRDSHDRNQFLTRLLDIISQYREIQRNESMDTICNSVYETGDLGFVPKQVFSRKSIISTAAVSTTSRLELAKAIPRYASKMTITHSESSSSTLTSSPDISLNTIPSIHLIPATEEAEVKPKDSLDSLGTSSELTGSEQVEEEESDPNMTETEKLLAQSKLEIQKSILKDLAYSRMALQSQTKLLEDRRSKSVLFETLGEDSKKEGDVKVDDSVKEGTESVVVVAIEDSQKIPVEGEQKTSEADQPLEEITEQKKEEQEPNKEPAE